MVKSFLTKKTHQKKRSKMEDLTTLFCSVDDFWKRFECEWKDHLIGVSVPRRGPKPDLSMSEMMVIVIMFHQSNYRTFKHFYRLISDHYRGYFPKLISYDQFVALMKNLFIPLHAYLLDRVGMLTGVAFIDATSIAVCHNKRIKRNRVFREFAKRGKTTAGWFYGFKLHLIINDKVEILSFLLTPGNIADVAVADLLSRHIVGKLFGDKGYTSEKLRMKLYKRGLELFTAIRSNMKPKLMSLKDKLLLRCRSLIETVNDQLKNISQIEHTRHRSVSNFLVNLLAGLAAYSHKAKKPSLNLDGKQNELIITA